jgi:hypothetical protein
MCMRFARVPPPYGMESGWAAKRICACTVFCVHVRVACPVREFVGSCVPAVRVRERVLLVARRLGGLSFVR